MGSAAGASSERTSRPSISSGTAWPSSVRMVGVRSIRETGVETLRGVEARSANQQRDAERLAVECAAVAHVAVLVELLAVVRRHDEDGPVEISPVGEELEQGLQLVGGASNASVVPVGDERDLLRRQVHVFEVSIAALPLQIEVVHVGLAVEHLPVLLRDVERAVNAERVEEQEVGLSRTSISPNASWIRRAARRGDQTVWKDIDPSTEAEHLGDPPSAGEGEGLVSASIAASRGEGECPPFGGARLWTAR